MFACFTDANVRGSHARILTHSLFACILFPVDKGAISLGNILHSATILFSTSTSVLLIVGPKCTLAALNAAPGESARFIKVITNGTVRRTDGRQTVTLRLPLDAACVKRTPDSSDMTKRFLRQIHLRRLTADR